MYAKTEHNGQIWGVCGLRMLHTVQDLRAGRSYLAALLHFVQDFSKFVTGYGSLLHLLQEFWRFGAS
ncbi:hypothetical protein ACFSQ7_03755 [Paenibacillus rhizoplanae]